MRLLLDAHVSGRVVAAALRRAGHDVLAIDEHAELEGLDDETVLQLASEQRRILVTFDVKDFPDILRQWANEGRSHAGCIIFFGLEHSEFGSILLALRMAFTRMPEQDQWRDVPVFLGRADS